jgi:hypothetical protein
MLAIRTSSFREESHGASNGVPRFWFLAIVPSHQIWYSYHRLVQQPRLGMTSRPQLASRAKGVLMAFSSSRTFASRMIALTAILLLCSVLSASGQSTDVRFPTAVGGREIAGVIPVRDIGDSRLTDHFYTFNGLPGDLLITVQSKNLNGDFDVFTAAELRPVMKVTVYAESSSSITKDIYLRKPDSLILRVEARSPNDDEGSYSIRFSGSFDAINNVAQAEPAQPGDDRNPKAGKSGDRKTTRVSSVGARIEEPVEEVAAKPTPEPTPVPDSKETSTAPVKKTAAATPNPRRARGRAASAKTPVKPVVSDADKSTADSNKEGSGETSGATTTKKPKTEPNKSTTADATNNAIAEESKTSDASNAANKPAPVRKGATRSNRKPPATANAEPPPENTQRLVIEIKDGTPIEYLMSNVRRVTVENGVVVILTKSGIIQRVPMSSIVRMSIGP